MKKRKLLKDELREKRDAEALPVYQPPRIITRTDDELLEVLGPAQACSGVSCIGFPEE